MKLTKTRTMFALLAALCGVAAQPAGAADDISVEVTGGGEIRFAGPPAEIEQLAPDLRWIKDVPVRGFLSLSGDGLTLRRPSRDMTGSWSKSGLSLSNRRISSTTSAGDARPGHVLRHRVQPTIPGRRASQADSAGSIPLPARCGI